MLDLSKKIAVIGAGSIGRRYISNLISLGYKNIFVLRQVGNNKFEIEDNSLTIFSSWDQLLDSKPYAAFVCNPTALHIESAIKLANAGVHVMIEKPLSNDLNNLDNLLNIVNIKNIYIQVGYMMRFHPILKELHNQSKLGFFGNLISIQSKWGEYLPDWHPWEDYRHSYAARKDLGGGVALTLSHEIDLANWLSNSKIQKWHILKNYSSKLEVDVESGAEIIIKYLNGLTANIHLNYYEKAKERFLKLIYENASVSIDFVENTMRVYKNNEVNIFTFDSFERNNLFIDQINFFLLKTQNFEKKDTINSINESINIIKICNDES